jgi:hypothetical protein
MVFINLPPLGARVFSGSPEAGVLCGPNIFTASATFSGHPSLRFGLNPVVTGKSGKLTFEHVLHYAKERINRLHMDGLRRVDTSDAGKPFVEFVGEVIASCRRDEY